MQVKIERVGNLALTVKENNGEKFYCLDEILKQTDRTPCALTRGAQTPIWLFNCSFIYSYHYTGEHFIQSVFVDERGLKQLTGLWGD